MESQGLDAQALKDALAKQDEVSSTQRLLSSFLSGQRLLFLMELARLYNI